MASSVISALGIWWQILVWSGQCWPARSKGMASPTLPTLPEAWTWSEKKTCHVGSQTCPLKLCILHLRPFLEPHCLWHRFKIKLLVNFQIWLLALQINTDCEKAARSQDNLQWPVSTAWDWKRDLGASLVALWRGGVCLSAKETGVWSLSPEEPTCRGGTGPVPTTEEASQAEESLCSHADPVQPKIHLINKLI